MSINAGIISGIPKLVATNMEMSLKQRAIFANLANRNYEGEISQYGDTVVITTPGSVTVNTYDGSDITYQDMILAEQELKIDQYKAYGFKIDTIDERFLKPSVMMAYGQEASYALSQNIEDFYAAKHSEADGDMTITASITSANVISTLSNAVKLLGRKNYPKGAPLWGVIPPWMSTKIQLADIVFNTNNSPTMTNGWLGRYLGVDWYESNNIVTTGTVGTENSKIMIGTPNTFTHAQAILRNRAKEAEKSYAVLVDGLLVYGGKLVRKDQLVVIDGTEAAETSI